MFEREGGEKKGGGGEKERWHRLSVGNLTTEHGINHKLLACDVIITVANSNAKTDSILTDSNCLVLKMRNT